MIYNCCNVASLAISSFLNGFWMSVGGYLWVAISPFSCSPLTCVHSIKSRSLPRFWYYSFHYMDYQRYAFELLANVSPANNSSAERIADTSSCQSDLRGLDFECTESCTCAYPSSNASSCTVSGEDVLRYLDIYDISYGSWVGILISIITIYRLG